MQYSMLIQIWLSSFKGMIYVWGLVEAQYQRKMERHLSNRPAGKSSAVVEERTENKQD